MRLASKISEVPHSRLSMETLGPNEGNCFVSAFAFAFGWRLNSVRASPRFFG